MNTSTFLETAMIWKKHAYYAEAETGHTIAFCRVKGIVCYVLYSPGRKCLGVFKTPEEARAAAL
jgi:hypothetical protein